MQHFSIWLYDVMENGYHTQSCRCMQHFAHGFMMWWRRSSIPSSAKVRNVLASVFSFLYKMDVFIHIHDTICSHFPLCYETFWSISMTPYVDHCPQLYKIDIYFHPCISMTPCISAVGAPTWTEPVCAFHTLGTHWGHWTIPEHPFHQQSWCCQRVL